MNYYLMHVNKAFGSFVKGGVYWIDKPNAIKAAEFNAPVTIHPYTLIPKYTNQYNLLLVRSGGIGDIIALSSLTNIADNTIILTQDKYKPLNNYFEDKCTFKSFNEPLFIVNYPNTIERECKKYGQMIGDERIEQGSQRNWYEILNESISQPFEEEYGRPQLKSLSQNISDCCIVVPSASNINRSADRDMLKKIASKYFEHVVMADEQSWTFEEYLQNLDKAKYVISVDTSAIHFREGIKRPALGIYSSFTTDSRTKYYTHTTSINIVNECKFSPCFKHDNQICNNITKESKHVPCLSVELSKGIEQQIAEAITNDINKETK